jgi:hypothetical protein
MRTIHTRSVRYAVYASGVTTAERALLALQSGHEVWLEGGGGLVEGQLAHVAPGPTGLVVDWNWGRRRRTLYLSTTASAALTLARRLVAPDV